MSGTTGAQLVVCLLENPWASDAVSSALSTELSVRRLRYDLWVTVPTDVASLRADEISLLITDHSGRPARRMFERFCPRTEICFLAESPSEVRDRQHFISPQCRLKDLALEVSGILPPLAEEITGRSLIPERHRSELVLAAIGQLKPQTRRLIEELAAGRSVKEAAARLGVAKRTAENMKYAAIDALNLRTSTDLLRYGIEWVRHLETSPAAEPVAVSDTAHQ